MVKVAAATPTPTPTPTPIPPPPPAVAPPEVKLQTAPGVESVDSPRPVPTPTPLPSPPPGPELSTAPELPPVLFASDQYEVGAEQTKALAKHAAYLKANTAIRVVLRGHTDASASEEYNLALGQKRAESVRQALIKLGIAANRIETVSFGESLPLQDGDAPGQRASNRRVEFFLYAVE